MIACKSASLIVTLVSSRMYCLAGFLQSHTLLQGGWRQQQPQQLATMRHLSASTPSRCLRASAAGVAVPLPAQQCHSANASASSPSNNISPVDMLHRTLSGKQTGTSGVVTQVPLRAHIWLCCCSPAGLLQHLANLKKCGAFMQSPACQERRHHRTRPQSECSCWLCAGALSPGAAGRAAQE